jgi:UDP-4-amino-4,6-dideoxy-N-acetyl-beta-L-altrosamine N-acetyltransferase
MMSMVDFKRLEKSHLEMVLKWRTDPEVSRYMASDIENDLDKQGQWYQKTLGDTSCGYWVIYCRNVPVGLIGVVDINREHRFCSWTYYIGDAEFRSEIGGYVPPFFYNYIFNELKLNKIITDVMAENQNVIKLHRFYGHRDIGLFHEHYYKNGRYHDVFVLELLAKDWKKLSNKFERFVSNFE